MKAMLSLASAVLLLPLSALAQETCGWMPTAEVDRLLPQAAPWSVMVGGKVGSCKFTSSGGPGGIAVIGAHQMLKADAAEAAKLAQSLRSNIEGKYDLQSVEGLGEHGFSYSPQAADAAASRSSISYVGHYKHVALTGQLVLPVGADYAAYAEGGRAFMRAALAIADDAGAAKAAGCAWFDESVVRRLLPGDGYSSQAFGGNSCMAQSSGMALILSVQEDVDAELAARMRDGSCTWTAQPSVGEGAMLGSECQGGRPRVLLVFPVGSQLLSYAFSPGRAPTAAETALLVELGSKIRAGRP